MLPTADEYILEHSQRWWSRGFDSSMYSIDISPTTASVVRPTSPLSTVPRKPSYVRSKQSTDLDLSFYDASLLREEALSEVVPAQGAESISLQRQVRFLSHKCKWLTFFFVFY